MTTLHVVSVSGGKDSTATLLLALERVGRDRVLPIFCDTGNEHELTYLHLDYLERALAKKIERVGPKLWVFRPIVDWTAQQTIDYAASRGIDPNPLYWQGMTRVGCMPCINVQKDELRQIAARFPRHVERIAEWESQVGRASKRGYSTMMVDSHPAQDPRAIFADLNIWARVEWSKTTRGGKQFDLLADTEPKACASAYGLCE